MPRDLAGLLSCAPALQVVLNSGFEEDVTVSNIKLGAGFSA